MSARLYLITLLNNDGIVQLVICKEWLHQFPIRIHGDTDSGESGVPIFVLELNVPRNFSLAATAPSCPKIQRDHFPLYADNLMGAPLASAGEKSGAGLPVEAGEGL